MRTRSLTLVVCLLLAGGCQQSPPPEPPAGPPAEDLSHWTVPALVQPEAQKPLSQGLKPPPRPATAAETVYDYVPGGVYKVTVALDAPLDLILETGEKVQALIGSDPKPIRKEHAEPSPEPGDAKLQIKERWEYKEAVDGIGEKANPHILLRALEVGATLGLTVTTSKRVYYLTCQSVAKSPIRAVRWKYPPEPPEVPTQEGKAPGLLPHPDEPRLYHVGYQRKTSNPAPTWTPRSAIDDGKKFYIIYPEIVLFGTVPLVRIIGPNGPQVVNSHQFLNVVILDLADVPRVELRVGTGERAELVTITRGNLRTIQCPEDNDCPRWPAAALHLAGR
jgi:type IV secretory pathway VirB9-like protein